MAASKIKFTQEQSEQLQEAVDKIFRKEGPKLRNLGLSMTIADPLLDGCPLIGCSTGFSKLSGYEMHEIVGRNCRFLVDPVPQELVDSKVRKYAREYCDAIRDGKTYQIPCDERGIWMPYGRHGDDGIFCVQKNARKDGSLFNNMFYLRVVELDDHPVILGLQTEIPGDVFRPIPTPTLDKPQEEREGGQEVEAENVYVDACRILDQNMADVLKVLATMFWCSGPMRRQDGTEAWDYEATPIGTDGPFETPVKDDKQEQSAKEDSSDAKRQTEPSSFTSLFRCFGCGAPQD